MRTIEQRAFVVERFSAVVDQWAFACKSALKRSTTNVLFLLLLVGTVNATNVRNGGFGETGYCGDTNDIQKHREAGWKCPDAKDWPKWWSGFGANVIFEWFATGGKLGDAFCRISGSGGSVVGYHGLDLQNKNQILTVWARGHGTLRAGVLAYGLQDDGQHAYQLTAAADVPPPLRVAVNSDVWVRYQHVMRKTPKLASVHVIIAAVEGTIDFDEVDLEPAWPARELMVREAEKLYGAGALVENLEFIQADANFQKRLAEYVAAGRAFREKGAKKDAARTKSIEQEITALDPYVQGAGKQVVLASAFNDMIVLTRVCASLADEPAKPAARVEVKEAVVSVKDYKPGVRPPREGMVTVTDIRSDKVRYDENETAHTRATVVNQSATLHKGTLIARMHLDVDTVREIARTEFSLAPKETKAWEFSYSVGPETYGRGIEVQFVEDDQVVDTWQEFYAVAADWFRVQLASANGPNKLYNVDFYT
ncbi:MAG: hypothetical protein HY300_14310, partial [Verrucomicrobia bacterium]|nr:hypothetical protein [Verrucomicrobiota bacterium]